jgi:hypothetical protein
VLQESRGLDSSSPGWAAAGYAGAIGEGRTICGTLFGGTVFLGSVCGNHAEWPPEPNDERRSQAIGSVQGLFRGFVERFGDTDCRTLTGCDPRNEEDAKRYLKEEVYKGTCYQYLHYVLTQCLGPAAREAQYK